MEFTTPYPFDGVGQNLNEVGLTNFLANNDKPIAKSPLYLLKELPPPVQVTGSTNLLVQFGLEATYNKFCGKKPKESLRSFLPDLPGGIDMADTESGSTLRSLIEKPPIISSKEIQPLSSNVLMSAFRLYPGPLPEQYRPLYQQQETRRRHKQHKKNSRPDLSVYDSQTPEIDEIKKHKKKKRDDTEKKKKKKDKEKDEKKKKKREKEKERVQT